MSDLFDRTPEASPSVIYQKGRFSLYSIEELKSVIEFKQNEAAMYGKLIRVPRLEAWFGLRPYAFGGRVEQPKPMPTLVRMIGDTAGFEARVHFDSCFANFYRSGDDCIAWHADDDDWIGDVIASVSFGVARRFVLRHNATKVKQEFSLGDGDLLVMLAGVQKEWQHCVPRERHVKEPRLNLTFRTTKGA